MLMMMRMRMRMRIRMIYAQMLYIMRISKFLGMMDKPKKGMSLNFFFNLFSQSLIFLFVRTNKINFKNSEMSPSLPLPYFYEDLKVNFLSFFMKIM